MKKLSWTKRRHRKSDYATNCPYEIDARAPSDSLPPTVHVNLAEFLERNNHCHTTPHYHRRAWFEDNNYLYRPDYGEDGAQLTFAQSKETYLVRRPGTSDYYFDMEDAIFDSRFMFPELPRGKLRFGKFHDNQLGRIFFLTGPHDATDLLLQTGDSIEIIPWTDRSSEALFTNLFQEKIRSTTDWGYKETEYIPPLTEAEQASEAHRADYTDRIQAMKDKFQQICEIRDVGYSSNPFDDPISIHYKNRRYFFNESDMVHLEAALEADHTFYSRLGERIDFVTSIVKYTLTEILTEFEVSLSLRIDHNYLTCNSNRESVLLTIYRDTSILHQHSIAIDDFMTPDEPQLAETLIKDVQDFFGRYREKFYAFKKLYDANLSYHRLVNPSSSPPELNYSFIFRSY